MVIIKRSNIILVINLLIRSLVILALLILPFTLNLVTIAPPYSAKNFGPGGYSIFNDRLKQEGFNTSRIILSTESLLDLPESSVLVISDNGVGYRNIEIQKLKAFLMRGGTLLVLSNSDPTNFLLSSLNVLLSTSNLMETKNYFKTPEIVLVKNPFESLAQGSAFKTLALFQPRAIMLSSEKALMTIKTNKTTFIDLNSDKKWSKTREITRSYEVARVEKRGLGFLIVVSSPSFLCNDYYYYGFPNINVTIALLKLYSNYMFSGSEHHIYFEESHKKWPLFSRDGLINQSYGNIALLSQTESFIVLIVLAILIIYYFIPKYRSLTGRGKNQYKEFLKEKIWSQERAIYDTFARAILPTEEEQILSSLYFEHENYPDKVFNIYLQLKFNNIDHSKMTKEEISLFTEAIKRELSYDLFLALFNKLEDISKRGIYK